jgi:hypothetical protein
MGKGKFFLANSQRIVVLFTQQIATKLSKIWVWDPGSGKKQILDPGSRGRKGIGSQIRNTLLIII